MTVSKSVLSLPGLLLLAPLTLGACAHEQQVGQTESSAGSGAISYSTRSTQGDQSCNADLECGERQQCRNARCTNISTQSQECGKAVVHFDYDSSTIAAEERGSLEQMASCLRSNHALQMTIQGNADERGTSEYNMALGDKRARAVAEYLEALGISESQLHTVSYGKERPLCGGHEEVCWSRNRRASVEAEPSL